MPHDRQSDPLKALARVAQVLRASRIESSTLRRGLEAARIAGISGLAVTEAPGRRPLAADPVGFDPADEELRCWSTSLHRGLLEAAGPDLRTPPYPTYLEALAALLSQAMRSQERVEATRQEFRSLLASFPAAIAMHRNGMVTYVNRPWTVLTGGVNVGESAIGWVLEQDRERAARAVERAESDPVVVRLSYDPTRWVEVEATTQMAFDGQEVSLVVAREITDQRAARADDAIQDRLDTTRWITSGIAHGLNNPLTALMANLEVAVRRIEKHGGDQPWTRELVEELNDTREAAERMRISIRDLRDLGREPGPKSEPVDLRRVVDGALGVTHRLLGHRCRVERHYEDVPPVLGRADGLGQVMVALFQNAAQAFARQDAASELPSSERPLHVLEIWIRRRGRHVNVEVADDGPGVPREMEAGLFEPFVGTGRGLGLALAKRIVDGLGGTISYDARSGHGSLFRVGVPIAEARDPQRTAAEPTSAPTTLGRVLVVDDEPMIGRAVRRMLAPDYEVVIATTGATGLDRLTTNPSWNLVLLDLMMPGMGGVEVYEEIERQLPELLSRVVVVTGGIYTQQAHAFLERTGCETLRKPFDAADLLRAIEEHQSH